MVADNDAGGITTYAATGAKYGYNLIWFLLLLIPVAYYVQEMTVRLGAVTKRGHAEAIFTGFGAFWGWFSLIDLMIVNWLTLVTEFIGMTSALEIFGIPAWLTYIAVVLLLGTIVFLVSMLAQPETAAATPDEPLGNATAPHLLYYSSAPGGNETGAINGPVVVEAYINGSGEVYDYRIVSGPTDATTRSQVESLLLFSRFAPARFFGQPVRGLAVLEFSGVSVRG